MFAGLLDVEDKIDWAENAPKQRNRKSQFLLWKTESDSCCSKPLSNILMLPAPAGQNDSGPSQPQKIAGPERNKSIARAGRAISKLANFSANAARTGLGRVAMCLDPVRIIGWIHILLNAFILAAVLYIFSYLLYFITVDVIYKIHQKKEEARAIIIEAKRLYVINRCDPTTRVPALEAQCGEWDCVSRNGLSGIRYTKIVVEVVADVLEGFVSKFSIRSYLVFASLLVVYLVFRR